MSASFQSADKATHRRVMIVGLLFCAAFVLVTYFARSPPADDTVLLKADRLVRTAGQPAAAN